MDQTGLNQTLQSNAAAYNPDCTAGKVAYAQLRAMETAGRTPDSAQIATKTTAHKKPGKPMPAVKRGR